MLFADPGCLERGLDKMFISAVKCYTVLQEGHSKNVSYMRTLMSEVQTNLYRICYSPYTLCKASCTRKAHLQTR